MTSKLKDSRRWAWWACWALGAAQCLGSTAAGAASTMPKDGSGATLSDPAATRETVSVYDVIKTRTTQNASNMIEGQHMGGPGDLEPDSTAFDMTAYRIDSGTLGRHAYPRMVGGRYDADDANHVYTLDAASIAQINQRLIDVSQTHHPMVSITATPRNPWKQAAGRAWVPGQGSLADLVISKRSENLAASRFWADIDTIADGLAGLKTAEGVAIPVVFRPFAEFNTGDKYYAKEQSAADFVTLWKQVADYYVKTRQLHNLMFTWEAWVWHRTAAQADLAPWYPMPSVDLPNPYVDIVTGAFYFQEGDTAFFSLDLPKGSNDEATFYNLMDLAVSHDKPFGAAQWAVNYKYGLDANGACRKGDNNNTRTFMSSVDAKHYAPGTVSTRPVQHMAFVYYWGDNKGCMAVQNQLNATPFVDDPRVASVTGLDYVNNEGGWIRESGPGTGKGGAIWAGLPLRTGDGLGPNGCSNCQYRSIVSFDTSAAMLPGNAVLGPDPATLRLTKSGTSLGTSPFLQNLGPLWIDAASGFFGAGPAFANDDFKTILRDQVHVGKMTDPATSASGIRSRGPLPVQYVNRQGHTQLRLSFEKATDNNGMDNYIDWNDGTGDTPELILTYTLPNP